MINPDLRSNNVPLNMINPDLRLQNVPLNMINPDLKKEVPLDAIDPDLKKGQWNKFAGGVTAPGTGGTQWTPAPSLAEVKAGRAELEKGQQGGSVTTIQAQLRASGQKISIDGKFGPETEGAVKAFQAKHGLPETGKVDADTAKALEAAAPKPQPQPQPRPNGGGGGGGGGSVNPPQPKPIPNLPKLPDDPNMKAAALYDLASNRLNNGYKKGNDPAFDAMVTTFMNMPDPTWGDSSDGIKEHMRARTNFLDAARKAGF